MLAVSYYLCNSGLTEAMVRQTSKPEIKMNIQNAKALIETLKETQAKPISEFDSSGFFTDDNQTNQQRKDAIVKKLILQIEWAFNEKSTGE